MAAKDLYHEHVRTALTKDGWKITNDPLTIDWMGTTLQIDFGAERLIKEIVKWISCTDIATS